MTFKFFIDTADHSYIEEKWKFLNRFVSKKHMVGITTNPNAFMKENLHTDKQWETRTRTLAELVTKIREDNKGVVYVQIPGDNLSEEKVLQWATMVSGWGDGQTKIALKLPPYKKYLDMVATLSKTIDINITGVADCGTALKCLQSKVRYVSIIPGRMEEVGIDAKAHVSFVMNAHHEKAKWDIITGSMRTLEGLKWCVEQRTIPTIGKKIIDLITEENAKEVFSIKPASESLKDLNSFAPVTEEKSKILSLQFFEQMNECGNETAKEFLQETKM